MAKQECICNHAQSLTHLHRKKSQNVISSEESGWVIGLFRLIYRPGNYERHDPNVAVYHLAGKRRLIEDYHTKKPQIQLKGLDTQNAHWAFFRHRHFDFFKMLNKIRKTKVYKNFNSNLTIYNRFHFDIASKIFL